MSDKNKNKKGLIGRLFSRKGKEKELPEAPPSPDEKQVASEENKEREEKSPVKESEEKTPEKELKEKAAVVEDVPDSAAVIKQETLPIEAVEEKSAVLDEDSQPVVESTGFFSRLKKGLSKTRQRFVGTLDGLFYGKKEIDEEFLEQLEEILLTSDLGVQTSYRLFAEVEEQVSHQALEDPQQLRLFLQQEIQKILQAAEQPWEINHKPYVIMTVGINGVGKTTTIGKLAAIFAAQGKEVVLGAADTFRAAAIEQLEIWSERAKVSLIRQKMGADPAAVSFDTVQSAVSRGADVVIIDTPDCSAKSFAISIYSIP